MAPVRRAGEEELSQQHIAAPFGINRRGSFRLPVVCVAEGWRFSTPLALRTLVVIRESEGCRLSRYLPLGWLPGTVSSIADPPVKVSRTRPPCSAPSPITSPPPRLPCDDPRFTAGTRGACRGRGAGGRAGGHRGQATAAATRSKLPSICSCDTRGYRPRAFWSRTPLQS